MKKTTKWILAALGIGVVCFVAVVAFVALLVLLSHTGTAKRELTEIELARLITLADLQAEGYEFDVSAACEYTTAKTNVDGTLELEYEYDTDRAEGCGEYLLYASEVEINASPADARQSFEDYVTMMRAAIGLTKGREMVERVGDFEVGEQHFASDVFQDGAQLGHLVIVQDHDSVYSLLIYGVWFEDLETLEQLMQQRLEYSAALR